MLVGGCECYSMCDRFDTGGISAGISAPPTAGISAGISVPPLTEPLRLLTFTGMCALVDVCQDKNPLLD
jgi:hypothetical protein